MSKRTIATSTPITFEIYFDNLKRTANANAVSRLDYTSKYFVISVRYLKNKRICFKVLSIPN